MIKVKSEFELLEAKLVNCESCILSGTEWRWVKLLLVRKRYGNQGFQCDANGDNEKEFTDGSNNNPSDDPKSQTVHNDFKDLSTVFTLRVIASDLSAREDENLIKETIKKTLKNLKKSKTISLF